MVGQKRKIHIDFLRFSPLIPWRRTTPNSSPNIAQPVAQQATQDGIKDAVQESVKSEAQNREKLNTLVENTETVLLRIGNIIPILKSEIVIDTSKVTVIHRPFFFSESINTIPIKNLTAIYIETSPFFATINMRDVNFAHNNFRVRWMLKGKAEKARRIMTGLMQATKEGIDLKSLRDDGVAEKLEEIGKIRETTTSASQN